MGSVAGIGILAGAHTQARQCRLCNAVVTPDALGLLECSCGWGGPDDPLETARGLSRAIQQLDRRLATEQARRDLLRLAKRGDAAGNASILHVALLVVFSTLIYVTVLGALAASIYLCITSILQQYWFAAGFGALLAVIFLLPLLSIRAAPTGVELPVADLPSLAAALADVCNRVGAPRPDHILVVPDARCFIYQRHTLRRLFRRELILGVGAAALQNLTDVEFKAILAHELAHYQHGDTLLTHYAGGALAIMRQLLDMALGGVQTQDRMMRRTPYSMYRRAQPLGTNSTLGFATIIMLVLSWTILLPFRLLWTALYLLRLRDSRIAEFQADRAAMKAYGAAAFINGLTSVRVSMRTISRARESLVQEMRASGDNNLYSTLRQHYEALPAGILGTLRSQAITGFRTLETTHPITPDRLRAAVTFSMQTPQPPIIATAPAASLLLPANATSAESLERQLTTLLLDGGKRRRSRRR